MRRLEVLSLSFIFTVAFVLLPVEKALGQEQKPQPEQVVPKSLAHPIENPAGLESFFKALVATKAGRRIEPVRIMHFGDSHTAADILTAEIRHSFQRDFGDGGAGLMVPRNPFSTQRYGVLSGATSGWWIDGIGNRTEADGIYGPAGFSLATEHEGERAWIETTCNHFEIYFLRQPGGGTIDIDVDGVSVLDHPLSLRADAPSPDYYTFDAPSDRNHRIEVKTLAAGKTRILGIVTEHIAPGVSYDVLGINGARATRLLSWNDTAFVDNVYQRKPDLIILAYGTNEVTDADWTVESYQRMFAGILRRFRRAAPQASILVYGPPDRADRPEAISKMPAMIEAQRRAAFEVGAAFWSSYAAMGGAGAMNSWASAGLGQPDHVHLSRAGYQRIGSMFYSDIMEAYQQYLARGGVRPRRRS